MPTYSLGVWRRATEPVLIGPQKGSGQHLGRGLMASEQAARVETAAPPKEQKLPSRPVDLVHLARYTLGERSLEREVLELFCTQSVLYLECLLYTSPSPRDGLLSRMPSS